MQESTLALSGQHSPLLLVVADVGVETDAEQGHHLVRGQSGRTHCQGSVITQCGFHSKVKLKVLFVGVAYHVSLLVWSGHS